MCLIVVRILEVIGFCLTRKRSDSIALEVSDFLSGETGEVSVSSESVYSVLNAVAVGVSIMVRVATRSPKV